MKMGVVLAVPAEQLSTVPPNPFKVWLAWVTVERGLSPSTVKGYSRELLALGPRRRLLNLTTEDLRKRLYAAGGSVSTRNGRIAAYRSFFGKAVQEGWRQDDPSLKLDRPRSRRGIPRPVEDLEAKMALLPPVYRHIAVLLSQTGMRLAELCRLDVPLPVSGRIDVLGKGSKWRRIPLTVKAQEALTALGGKVDVGPRAIQHAFHKVGMHPHALRHHFGCACAEAGVDAFVLQDLLGHASPATTRGYVMNSERRLREGISKLEASG